LVARRSATKSANIDLGLPGPDFSFLGDFRGVIANDGGTVGGQSFKFYPDGISYINFLIRNAELGLPYFWEIYRQN